jgi:hypothetical protein
MPLTFNYLDHSAPVHGLRTPREEIAFTAQPKIHSHSQIFRYGRSILCLPQWPKFSDFFDLCLHYVSVVRAPVHVFDQEVNITCLAHKPKIGGFGRTLV